MSEQEPSSPSWPAPTPTSGRTSSPMIATREAELLPLGKRIGLPDQSGLRGLARFGSSAVNSPISGRNEQTW